MAMGGYNYYDVAGGAAGMNVAMTPEERQLRQMTNMIKSAEATNYDGDPEYYQQIKTLAMQAGVPIKGFKTNPFRLAKAGLLSFLSVICSVLSLFIYSSKLSASSIILFSKT